MTDLNLSGKNILITGGAGFIGSNLALYFQSHHPGANVVIFDSFRSEKTFSNGHLTSLGHFKNLLTFRGEVIAGDITNAADLARLAGRKWDYIFHQAAISDTTIADQNAMIRANTNAFADLLEIASNCGARVIYASSAGTYGNTPAPNIVGQNEQPANVYGFSKLMMDAIVWRKIAQDRDFHAVGLRYFNVYGPRELHKAKTASMVLQLGLQALQNGVVRLFEFGEQKRDFVHVSDVVQANVRAMSGKRGVYNVGSGVARSYNDIVAALRASLGLDFKVEFIKNPYEFFQNHTQADITATRDALGYEPRFMLEAGVKDYAPEIRKIFESGDFGGVL